MIEICELDSGLREQVGRGQGSVAMKRSGLIVSLTLARVGMELLMLLGV